MKALLSVYDKTGIEEFARGLADLGLGAGLERGHLGRADRGRHRPRRGGRAHRCPRDAGRPGQDPPPGDPRRHPGRPLQARPPRRPRPAGHRPHRPGGVQPLPVHLRPLDRAHRRRRAHHGAGRGQEPRPRRPWSSTPPTTAPVLEELRADGSISLDPPPAGPPGLRPHRRLRRRHRGVARRAGAGGRWPTGTTPSASDLEVAALLPETIHLTLERAGSLRYGENPHQHGARYRVAGQGSWWDHVVQYGGKELSYLNVFDADAAWRLVHELPSGPDRAGRGHHQARQPVRRRPRRRPGPGLRAALACDPQSAFGGIVAIGGRVTAAVAEAIAAGPQADVIIAPAYDDEALGPAVVQAQGHPAAVRPGARAAGAPVPVPRGQRPGPGRRPVPGRPVDLGGGHRAPARPRPSGGTCGSPGRCAPGPRRTPSPW